MDRFREFCGYFGVVGHAIGNELVKHTNREAGKPDPCHLQKFRHGLVLPFNPNLQSIQSRRSDRYENRRVGVHINEV